MFMLTRALTGHTGAAIIGGAIFAFYPFRYERFATGDLHPVSHSPYPWS